MEIYEAVEPGNFAVSVLHYFAPLVVLLYFLFFSLLYVGGPGVDATTRATESFWQKSLRWIFLIAILTFVRILCV
jgi:hypothetical protein